MKSKTKYLLMWYISFLFLAVSLLLFGILIALHWSRLVYGYFAIGFFAVFAVLFFICRKPLQCKGGYSLVQAIAYYRACTKAGCDVSTLQQNEEILLQQAVKENMEQYDIQKVFCINPLSPKPGGKKGTFCYMQTAHDREQFPI